MGLKQQIPSGNDRKKSKNKCNGNDGLDFVVSHPGPSGGVKDGAPALVVGTGVVGSRSCSIGMCLMCFPNSKRR